MSIKKYPLACPRCKANLINKNKRLVCKLYNHQYQIRNGIPILLSEDFTKEVKISQRRWEEIYKKENANQTWVTDPQVQSHIKFLSRYSKSINGIYLDLGCGVSKTSIPFAKSGAQVIGIDISLEGLKKSKILYDKNKLSGLFIQANYLNIPIKNDSIDFIYWGLALEYVEDIQQAIKEVYRVAKKGGRIVAAFPVLSIGNLTYQQLRGDIPRIPVIRDFIRFIHLDIFNGKFLKFGYGQSFTTSFIEKEFIQAGFQVKKINFFDTYYPIDFIPELIRPLIRKILRWRIFWPFAYIEAEK